MTVNRIDATQSMDLCNVKYIIINFCCYFVTNDIHHFDECDYKKDFVSDSVAKMFFFFEFLFKSFEILLLLKTLMITNEI